MPEALTLTLGGLVILAAVVAIARRMDVRLVMFLAGLTLASLAGDPMAVVRTFLATLSSEQYVIPICSAMGFAYVLRETGCDRHLVHLLTHPLRYARPLLIPGAVVVGFVVNIAVISQAATAVAVGTVLIPLLRNAGLSPTTAGASVLLGASIGGELLNPGAPELNTVANELGIKSQDCASSVARLLFPHLAVATIVFWWLSLRAERKYTAAAINEEPACDTAFRLNVLKAIVPLVPLALLMTAGPPLNLFSAPQGWLVSEKLPGRFGPRLIGLSMLIGAALATLASPRTVRQSAKHFFDGAGYALTNMVAIIVTASCFGEGIERIGLAAWIGHWIRDYPAWLWPLASTSALAFAVLCGSGMATTQSLFQFFVVPTLTTETLIRAGALISISAAAGRTSSPVAAVVLMCATLTASEPMALVRRVAIPLLVATAVTTLLAACVGDTP